MAAARTQVILLLILKETDEPFSVVSWVMVLMGDHWHVHRCRACATRCVCVCVCSGNYKTQMFSKESPGIDRDDGTLSTSIFT
jgi:hypothetical protein